MASFDAVSLAGVRGRLVFKDLQVQNALDVKFAGPLNGADPGGGGRGGPFIPGLPFRPRLPSRPPVFRPPPFTPGGGVTPFTPITPFTPGVPFSPLVPGPGLPGPGLPGPGAGGIRGLGQLGCEFLSGRARDICLLTTGFLPGAPAVPQVNGACPAGQVRIGQNCVDFSAAFPGGDPFVSPGGGVASVGAFGLPALSPSGVTRVVRRCGRGMVLGIDDLCYPKAVLPARSKFRKWRRPPRAPVTRRDVVAIRRAASARERVLELAKDVGLSVTKGRRSVKKKASGAHKH